MSTTTQTYRYWLWYHHDMDYTDVHTATINLPETPTSAILHVDVDPNVPGMQHGCLASIKVNGIEVASFPCSPIGANCDVWEGDVTDKVREGENYFSVEVCVNITLMPLFIPLGGLTGWLEVTYPPGVTPPPPPGPGEEEECKLWGTIPIGTMSPGMCSAINTAATLVVAGIGVVLLIKLLK